jgi:aspartyl-tRNA(Asn)/glutamyl-tRNA(Gln) amidotransferase subunit B
VQSDLPELPDAKRRRYREELGLSAYDADVLCQERDVAAYFEQVVDLQKATTKDAKSASNFVMGQLSRELNKEDSPAIFEAPVTPKHLAVMIDMINQNTISSNIAKTEVFDEMWATGKMPDAIVTEKGLAQISDTTEIESAVDEVIATNPSEVEAYRGGKTKLMGFFVGQVMRATGGKANPQIVNQLVRDKLGSS